MSTRRGRPRDDAARARILASAAELFTRRGYLATTLTEIAEAAGTAVQTIYTAHGSKVGVLAAAHDVALAGDDEPVPLSERAWFRALGESPSAVAAWEAALGWMYRATERVAPLYAVMLAAEADPAVGELLATMRSQRLEFSRLLVAEVVARPGGEGVDETRLADVVYASECVETYLLLVEQRDWTVQAWRDWVDGVVRAELTR